MFCLFLLFCYLELVLGDFVLENKSKNDYINYVKIIKLLIVFNLFRYMYLNFKEFLNDI